MVPEPSESSARPQNKTVTLVMAAVFAAGSVAAGIGYSVEAGVAVGVVALVTFVGAFFIERAP